MSKLMALQMVAEAAVGNYLPLICASLSDAEDGARAVAYLDDGIVVVLAGSSGPDLRSAVGNKRALMWDAYGGPPKAVWFTYERGRWVQVATWEGRMPTWAYTDFAITGKRLELRGSTEDEDDRSDQPGAAERGVAPPVEEAPPPDVLDLG